MKKIILFLSVLLTIAFFTTFSMANDINIKINGKNIDLKDASVFVDKSNRTLVPIRFIADNLGEKISWNAVNKIVTVQKGSKKLEINLSRNKITIDGQDIKTDSYGQIRNNRVYVPLRLIAEFFGASVNYANKEVIIDTTKNSLTNKADSEERSIESESAMIMQIDDKTVEVDWEDNKTVSEIKKELLKGDLEIKLSKYGGFEQVGDLGKNYSTSDKRITTEIGDIVLYSGNKMVIFYGNNTWAYTSLGKIKNLSKDEIVNLLNKDDVAVKLKIKE